MKFLTFHIEHGDWSADLQIPAIHALSDLAEAIIDAVGFKSFLTQKSNPS